MICIVNKGVSRLLLQNQSLLTNIRKSCCADAATMTRAEFAAFVRVRV